MISNDILEPKTCAWLFDGDDDRWEYGRAAVKDGFEIGMQYSMDEYPVYVENDDLSAIIVYEGNLESYIWVILTLTSYILVIYRELFLSAVFIDLT